MNELRLIFKQIYVNQFDTKVLLLSMLSQLKIDEIAIFYDEQKKYRCKPYKLKRNSKP